MPKRWYRVEISMYDESNDKVASKSHKERYENHREAEAKLEEKDAAARRAGKGSGQSEK